MGRKRSPGKKKKGGLLIGLRGGVKKAVGVGGSASAEAQSAKKSSPWRGMNLVWNVLTAAACLLAVAVLLRRCGVVKW